MITCKILLGRFVLERAGVLLQTRLLSRCDECAAGRCDDCNMDRPRSIIYSRSSWDHLGQAGRGRVPSAGIGDVLERALELLISEGRIECHDDLLHLRQ